MGFKNKIPGVLLHALDKKFCGAPQGQIRAAKERVAQSFGAEEEARLCRRYERLLAAPVGRKAT
jgi:hypothetical protein